MSIVCSLIARPPRLGSPHWILSGVTHEPGWPLYSSLQSLSSSPQAQPRPAELSDEEVALSSFSAWQRCSRRNGCWRRRCHLLAKYLPSREAGVAGVGGGHMGSIWPGPSSWVNVSLGSGGLGPPRVKHLEVSRSSMAEDLCRKRHLGPISWTSQDG